MTNSGAIESVSWKIKNATKKELFKLDFRVGAILPAVGVSKRTSVMNLHDKDGFIFSSKILSFTVLKEKKIRYYCSGAA